MLFKLNLGSFFVLILSWANFQLFFLNVLSSGSEPDNLSKKVLKLTEDEKRRIIYNNDLDAILDAKLRRLPNLNIEPPYNSSKPMPLMDPGLRDIVKSKELFEENYEMFNNFQKRRRQRQRQNMRRMIRPPKIISNNRNRLSKNIRNIFNLNLRQQQGMNFHNKKQPQGPQGFNINKPAPNNLIINTKPNEIEMSMKKLEILSNSLGINLNELPRRNQLQIINRLMYKLPLNEFNLIKNLFNNREFSKIIEFLPEPIHDPLLEQQQFYFNENDHKNLDNDDTVIIKQNYKNGNGNRYTSNNNHDLLKLSKEEEDFLNGNFDFENFHNKEDNEDLFALSSENFEKILDDFDEKENEKVVVLPPPRVPSKKSKEVFSQEEIDEKIKAPTPTIVTPPSSNFNSFNLNFDSVLNVNENSKSEKDKGNDSTSSFKYTGSFDSNDQDSSSSNFPLIITASRKFNDSNINFNGNQNKEIKIFSKNEKNENSQQGSTKNNNGSGSGNVNMYRVSIISKDNSFLPPNAEIKTEEKSHQNNNANNNNSNKKNSGRVVFVNEEKNNKEKKKNDENDSFEKFINKGSSSPSKKENSNSDNNSHRVQSSKFPFDLVANDDLQNHSKERGGVKFPVNLIVDGNSKKKEEVRVKYSSSSSERVISVSGEQKERTERPKNIEQEEEEELFYKKEEPKEETEKKNAEVIEDFKIEPHPLEFPDHPDHQTLSYQFDNFQENSEKLHINPRAKNRQHHNHKLEIVNEDDFKGKDGEDQVMSSSVNVNHHQLKEHHHNLKNEDDDDLFFSSLFKDEDGEEFKAGGGGVGLDKENVKNVNLKHQLSHKNRTRNLIRNGPHNNNGPFYKNFMKFITNTFGYNRRRNFNQNSMMNIMMARNKFKKIQQQQQASAAAASSSAKAKDPISAHGSNNIEDLIKETVSKTTVKDECDYFSNEVCLYANDYPINDIKKAMNNLHPEMQSQLFMLNNTQMQQNLNYFDNNNPENREEGGFLCPSKIALNSKVKKAKSETSKEWKYIVNFDNSPPNNIYDNLEDFDDDLGHKSVKEYKQLLRLEKCLTPGDKCSYIIPYYHTTCKQLYNYHRLLAWDAVNGVHYDIFKMPACCTCHVQGYYSNGNYNNNKSKMRPNMNKPHPNFVNNMKNNNHNEFNKLLNEYNYLKSLLNSRQAQNGSNSENGKIDQFLLPVGGGGFKDYEDLAEEDSDNVSVTYSVSQTMGNANSDKVVNKRNSKNNGNQKRGRKSRVLQGKTNTGTVIKVKQYNNNNNKIKHIKQFKQQGKKTNKNVKILKVLPKLHNYQQIKFNKLSNLNNIKTNNKKNLIAALSSLKNPRLENKIRSRLTGTSNGNKNSIFQNLINLFKNNKNYKNFRNPKQLRVNHRRQDRRNLRIKNSRRPRRLPKMQKQMMNKNNNGNMANLKNEIKKLKTLVKTNTNSKRVKRETMNFNDFVKNNNKNRKNKKNVNRKKKINSDKSSSRFSKI